MIGGNFIRNRFRGLGASMAGQGGAFSPSGQPQLPANFGFSDLAGFEESRRQDFAKQAKQNILGFADEFQKQAADRRASLSKSLLDMGQQQFMKANPAILEDLNSRGLFTSQTARDQEQGRLLQDITMKNQEQLLAQDQADNQALNEIRQAALATELQGGQDALDASLDLRRGQLEAGRADAQAAEERALAEQLAGEQRRGGITQSLIGLGGQLGGPLLAAKLFGGGAAAGAGGGSSLLGGLLPLKGAAGMAPGSTLSGGGGAGLFKSLMTPGAGGMLGTGAGLLGGGYLGQTLAKLTGKNTREAKAGSAIGAALGTAALGPLGGLAGGALGGAATKAVQGIGKSLKKAFCFDAETPITMADGSIKKISEVELGDETKGGTVESVRKSITADGTRYNYQGVYVTGTHAVLENGLWKRVEDSTYGIPVDEGGVVYSLATDRHRIYVNGMVFADELEHDEYEDLTIDESLDLLNADLVGVR